MQRDFADRSGTDFMTLKRCFRRLLPGAVGDRDAKLFGGREFRLSLAGKDPTRFFHGEFPNFLQTVVFAQGISRVSVSHCMLG